jgi:hypothetical protein
MNIFCQEGQSLVSRWTADSKSKCSIIVRKAIGKSQVTTDHRSVLQVHSRLFPNSAARPKIASDSSEMQSLPVQQQQQKQTPMPMPMPLPMPMPMPARDRITPARQVRATNPGAISSVKRSRLIQRQTTERRSPESEKRKKEACDRIIDGIAAASRSLFAVIDDARWRLMTE